VYSVTLPEIGTLEEAQKRTRRAWRTPPEGLYK
jgi:hypothetical protein